MSYTEKDVIPLMGNCPPMSMPPVSDRVAAIKGAADELAELINEHCPGGPLKDKAIIDVQSASMFAVKSLFS